MIVKVKSLDQKSYQKAVDNLEEKVMKKNKINSNSIIQTQIPFTYNKINSFLFIVTISFLSNK